MKNLSKKIILDELIEDSHLEKVEDVIFWALDLYAQETKTTGSTVAYAIVQRIKDAEKEGKESLQNLEVVNLVTEGTLFKKGDDVIFSNKKAKVLHVDAEVADIQFDDSEVIYEGVRIDCLRAH